MPQLKIQDVKDDVEKLEKELKDALNNVDHLLGQIVTWIRNKDAEEKPAPEAKEEHKCNCQGLKKAIADLRKDLVGHVGTYNKHIMQQHKPQK